MVSLVQELFGIDNSSIFTVFQLKLIELLKEKGPMTRDEICDAFGFKEYEYHYIQKYTHTGTLTHYDRIITQHHNRTTIYDNLLKLIKRKIVKKFSKNNGKRGRPKVYFELTS